MEIGKASGHFASIKVCDDHWHKIFMLVKGFDFFAGLSDHDLAHYFAAGGSRGLFGQGPALLAAFEAAVLWSEVARRLGGGAACSNQQPFEQLAGFALARAIVSPPIAPRSPSLR